MGLNSNNSSIVSSGSQKLRDIFTVRNVKNGVGAAVLFLLSACGSEKQKLPHVEKPVDPVQKINAQVGSISANVVEIEITDKDGNIKVIPQSQFTQSYVKSLPEGALAYAVVVDGVKTKIQGLSTDKVLILSQFANEITDYIQRNKLNSSGVRELLKAIAFPDINKDGAIDEKDVVSQIPAEYKAPFAAYIQLLKDGATETQIKEQLKADFEKQNLVSDVQKTDPNTGEIVVTLTASSSNRTLLVQIIRSEEAQTGKVQFAAPMYSGENIMQVQSGESITLLPGDKIIYGEKDNFLNAESAKKEIINQKDKPQLKETQFKLKEDEKVSGKLEAQYVGVTNFKVVTPPTKGKLTLNTDGTFEYAGGEDQYGLDTAVVSFELSGKVYQTQIQINIEAVNDIPTSKNLDLGAVEFGASKTLSASDIATDKDGDTLKIVIASTSNGASVTLNADGTLTFTADKVGAGEILVMVTDDKSAAVAVKVTYNVSEKPLEKAALENLLNTYKSLYDTGASEYTPSTFNAFKTAYDAAKVALSTAKTQSDLDKAAADLEAAKTALVKQANKETLKSLIAVAEGFLTQKDDYTKGSFASFESKLTAAKAIVENKEAKPEDVKKAEDDLTAAVDALVSIKDLKALIASLPTNSALYTPASWTALQTALTAANAVLGNDNASKDAVNTATSNLTNAKSALVLVGNKTALNNLIASAPTVSSNYTSGSWSVLSNALTAANTVKNDVNATQTQIDAAVASLQAAINALVNIVALNNAISSVPTDSSLYTPASWAVLQTALTNANTVKNTANATQIEVNNAVTGLQNAISQLLFKGNKTTLINLIDSLASLIQSHYSTGSWTVLSNALTAANTVKNDANATQTEIDAALTNLQNAKDALVNIQGLKALIDSLPSPTTESDYTPASWTALQTAKDAAILIRDKANATQTEVNTAITNLQTAKNGLVFVGNKTALTNLITTVNGLTQTHYTVGSWNTLQTVKNAAVSVRDNVNASQDDVNTAVTNLQNAQNALVNIQGLKAAIASAASHTVPGNYTSSSWSAFETSLNTANSVLANDNATAGQVTAATGDLLIKTTNLVSIQTLKATIVQAESKTQSDYTTSSWSALQTAKDAAILIRNKADATQSEVNTANTNLQNAIDNLVEGIAPTISNFVISDADGGAVAGYTNNRTINISITANDNVGVTGYYISESSTPPNAGQYVATAPTTFELSAGDGTKTVYLWVKDAAGNVSALLSRTITLLTGAPAYNGWDVSTPTTQGTTYTDMKIKFSRSLQSFTLNTTHQDGAFPNGGTASGFSVNATNKNIVDIASLTTPNDATYRINGTVVDLAGNSANITIVAGGLEAPAPTWNTITLENDNFNDTEEKTIVANLSAFVNNLPAGATFKINRISGLRVNNITISGNRLYFDGTDTSFNGSAENKFTIQIEKDGENISESPEITVNIFNN